MSRFWMVRAGRGGSLAGDFERTNHIAVGWDGAGDFTPVRSLDQMRARMAEAYPDEAPGMVAGAASMTWKFREVMKKGDRVMTYNPATREYLIGVITGDYRYAPGVVPDYNHVRAVQWEHRVRRDALSLGTRNTLGATLTIFEPGDTVVDELQAQLAPGGSPASAPVVDARDEGWQESRSDVVAEALENIKDRLLRLSPSDMEELTAALLRGMGYKARVTQPGPDRGRDVVASPDGLGFQSPRIVAEVKHRPNTPIGAPELRSFLGGLRASDSGLYVSTGGFTLQAKYEADRAPVPLTLVDLDHLASLVTEHYEGFDTVGRGILPLVRVYYPAS